MVQVGKIGSFPRFASFKRVAVRLAMVALPVLGGCKAIGCGAQEVTVAAKGDMVFPLPGTFDHLRRANGQQLRFCDSAYIGNDGYISREAFGADLASLYVHDRLNGSAKINAATNLPIDDVAAKLKTKNETELDQLIVELGDFLVAQLPKEKGILSLLRAPDSGSSKSGEDLFKDHCKNETGYPEDETAALFPVMVITGGETKLRELLGLEKAPAATPTATATASAAPSTTTTYTAPATTTTTTKTETPTPPPTTPPTTPPPPPTTPPTTPPVPPKKGRSSGSSL